MSGAEFHKGAPAPHLSLAFLELWDGRFREALAQYIEAAECEGGDHQMVISVVRFLDVVADSNPNRPELRFGLGFVNENFFDEARARVEYERFLAETAGNEKYDVLAGYAKAQLLAG